LPFAPTTCSTSASSNSPSTPRPDLDRQREQSLSRCPEQLPERLLHPLREHALVVDRLGDRYVAHHGGSSFDLAGSPATLPTRSGQAGGTAVTSNFYEPRDNLQNPTERADGSAREARHPTAW
jgi:hypothetical protein